MSDHNIDDPNGNIPLAETLKRLRHELQVAQLQSEGEDILFEMDKVELELKVVISRKSAAEGGIAFWVIKAGGAIENSGETTHVVKLTLTPVNDQTGSRVRVKTQGSNKTKED